MITDTKYKIDANFEKMMRKTRNQDNSPKSPSPVPLAH